MQRARVLRDSVKVNGAAERVNDAAAALPLIVNGGTATSAIEIIHVAAL